MSADLTHPAVSPLDLIHPLILLNFLLILHLILAVFFVLPLAQLISLALLFILLLLIFVILLLMQRFCIDAIVVWIGRSVISLRRSGRGERSSRKKKRQDASFHLFISRRGNSTFCLYP